jgi:hypothetical protein
MVFVIVGVVVAAVGVLLWCLSGRATGTARRARLSTTGFALMFLGLPLIPLGLLVLSLAS